MVSTIVFVVAVSLLSGLVLTLTFSTSFLYLKLRSHLHTRTRSPAPPLVSATQNSSKRPPNHHLATSNAYSNLDFAQLRFSRPPSFLQIDPSAQNHGATESQVGLSPTMKRISIATTISRNGSRVLTRNSSTQDSHERRRSAGSERKAGVPDSREVVIERTKRNRKSFGVGNEEFTIEVEVEGGEGERMQIRRRSSTWTTEDLGQLVEATDAFAPSDLEIRAAKRSSLSNTRRRLSLGIRSEALRSETFSLQKHCSLSTPPPLQLASVVRVEASPSSDISNHDRRCQALPFHLHDPRFSASSQALMDLEIYAADLSQPPTPSFSPRPLSTEQTLRPNHPLHLESPFTTGCNAFHRGQDGGGGGESVSKFCFEIDSSRRPLSWLKRQGSSGTLPEQVLDHTRLAVRIIISIVVEQNAESSSWLSLIADCES
ncbi:hypothetical protein JCM5350_004564 [Sporobolomyces pararoseus]